MQNEPRALLRNPDILGELGAGDPFLVACDQPDGKEPLVKREFRILEDRPDLDRKPLPAVAALVGPVIRKIVDARAAAVGAECTVRPADRPEVIDACLFVRESAG